MNDETDDIVETLKAHGERVGGTLKIIRATPPDELTRALVGELKGLLDDSFTAVEVAMDQLARLVSAPPRQTRIDDFAGPTSVTLYPGAADKEGEHVRR
jgi:hypothetical protein